MIRYEDINITAFCGAKTMDKLVEHLPLVSSSETVRAIKYGIVTVYESPYHAEECLSLIKDLEYEKLEQFKKEQKELSDKLDAFQELLGKINI